MREAPGQHLPRIRWKQQTRETLAHVDLTGEIGVERAAFQLAQLPAQSGRHVDRFLLLLNSLPRGRIENPHAKRDDFESSGLNVFGNQNEILEGPYRHQTTCEQACRTTVGMPGTLWKKSSPGASR